MDDSLLFLPPPWMCSFFFGQFVFALQFSYQYIVSVLLIALGLVFYSFQPIPPPLDHAFHLDLGPKIPSSNYLNSFHNDTILITSRRWNHAYIHHSLLLVIHLLDPGILLNFMAYKFEDDPFFSRAWKYFYMTDGDLWVTTSFLIGFEIMFSSRLGAFCMR